MSPAAAVTWLGSWKKPASITPTQVYKGNIGLKDLVFLDLEGKVVEGKRRPTGETPMYLKFFKMRKDIVSVVHCHAPNVGAFAISKEELVNASHLS